jgi:hypothetical protein
MTRGREEWEGVEDPVSRKRDGVFYSLERRRGKG